MLPSCGHTACVAAEAAGKPRAACPDESLAAPWLREQHDRAPATTAWLCERIADGYVPNCDRVSAAEPPCARWRLWLRPRRAGGGYGMTPEPPCDTDVEDGIEVDLDAARAWASAATAALTSPIAVHLFDIVVGTGVCIQPRVAFGDVDDIFDAFGIDWSPSTEEPWQAILGDAHVPYRMCRVTLVDLNDQPHTFVRVSVSG